MPSPFPGMNPYFEQPGVWRGFHTSFLIRLADALTPQANPRYFVNVEQSVYIDRGEDERDFLGYADATVTRTLDATGTVAGGTATLEAPETGTVRYGATKKTHRWLTIRDTSTRRVVTVIELLTPSNKMGGNRGEYLRKRRRVLRSSAHLVEIDLLRGGPRMPTGGVRASDYRILVSRRPDRPRVQVWPVGLREPLPSIPIPVRTGETDLRLELKSLVDEVYDKGGYLYQLYGTPPEPPLSPDDAEWARQFVPTPR